MINLLDSKNIFQRVEGKFDLSNQFDVIIQQKLKEGSKNKELIYTQDLRGIGKTYELIKFAKHNSYIVIVHNNAESFRKIYNYDNIYNESSLYTELKGIINNRKIVVDEGVNFQKIKEEGYYEIITGYSNKYINENYIEETSKTLNEEIVDNFKNEVRQLNQKLQKLREKDDYSMYKNIINSYRDIVKIIQELDWTVQYSEYKREISSNTYIKEIAVWEQNGDGQIRNHQKWQIKENCKTNDIDINNITIENNKNIKAIVLPIECGEFSNNAINMNILGGMPFASIDSAEKYIKELEKINMFGMFFEANKNI